MILNHVRGPSRLNRILGLTLALTAPARADPRDEPPRPEGTPPEVAWSIPPEAPPDASVPEREVPTTQGAPPSRRRGRNNWTLDLGLHTYLVRSKYFAGAQVGASRDFFAIRFDGGALWNSERVERFDTTFLGPYLFPTAWLYPLRTDRVEVRGGVGLLAVGLTAVDDSIWYFAGSTSVAASYFFTEHLSAMVRADVLPFRSPGFVLDTAPVLAQVGLEVSLW